MKSHEYAHKLQELAQFLLDRPEFNVGDYSAPYLYIHADNKKEMFLDAVRALKPGTKKYAVDNIEFTPTRGPKDVTIRVEAYRSTVCRKIRDAEYECEPLLDHLDEEEVDAAVEAEAEVKA